MERTDKGLSICSRLGLESSEVLPNIVSTNKTMEHCHSLTLFLKLFNALALPLISFFILGPRSPTSMFEMREYVKSLRDPERSVSERHL